MAGYGMRQSVGWTWTPPTKWENVPSSVVWPLAGDPSDRPWYEIIVVVVEQTIYSIYNIIVGRGYLGIALSSR